MSMSSKTNIILVKLDEASASVRSLDVSDRVDLATTDKIAEVARAVISVHELQKEIVTEIFHLQQRIDGIESIGSSP